MKNIFSIEMKGYCHNMTYNYGEDCQLDIVLQTLTMKAKPRKVTDKEGGLLQSAVPSIQYWWIVEKKKKRGEYAQKNMVHIHRENKVMKQRPVALTKEIQRVAGIIAATHKHTIRK